jgi:hypothetical protein
MIENTIADVQELERSVDGKSLPDLQIRLALRGCLKELRMLTADPTEYPTGAYQPAIPIGKNALRKQTS